MTLDKKIRLYYSRIRSRHPSHDQLRRNSELRFPFRSIIRFGSKTDDPNSKSNGGEILEINTVEAIKNSSSKLRMKQCFNLDGVKTPKWYKILDLETIESVDTGKKISITSKNLKYPLIGKHIFGSRGNGIYYIQNSKELKEFLYNHKIENYIIERYMNYSREYRLHVSENGCFYTCRKMLKIDGENRHIKNDSNCAWFLEENEQFDKPSNWDDIVNECVKALKSVGLDIGACDVRVQSSDKKNPDFTVIEINSAPSFGKRTKTEYIDIIKHILPLKNKN